MIKKTSDSRHRATTTIQQLYIDNSESQSYLAYFPDGWSEKSNVLVCVHGISRKFKEQIRLLKKDAAKSDTIIVAPCFSDKHHHAYQRHETGTDGLRSDQVLDNILMDVSRRFSINIDRFELFGFSGGAQFAHRYALRHPDRIARLTTCAAGWYTLPDFSMQFPYGLANGKNDSTEFNISEEHLCDFLKIPITVTVGEYDKRSESSLNRSKIINNSQGYDRLERAITWARCLINAAEERRIKAKIKFILIPRSGHSFFECVNYGMLSRYLFNHS